MLGPRLGRCALSLWFLLLVASAAHAQGEPAAPAANAEGNPAEAAKKEARERFDQGLKLFNEGNNAAALAEFERAYAVLPNAVVRLNIARVYAAMNRPVDAVDVLEQLLDRPAELSPEDVASAAQLRAEQHRRIATITLDLTRPGAVIEIDGKQVGKTPLDRPLRVSAGQHVVSVVLTGYHPVHQEVTIAGGESRALHLELVALAERKAALAIRSNLIAGAVWVDGKKRGALPLESELALTPGKHRVELRRECYRTATATITLAAGTSGEVRLEPAIDTAALSRCGGQLSLSIAQGSAVIELDGTPAPAGRATFELPQGKHRVRVTREGHLPFETVVDVPAQGTASLAVDLQPKADVLAAARRRTRRQRALGLSALGVGIAGAGASAGFLVWNQGERDDAQAAIDDFNAIAEDRSGGRCDALSGITVAERQACEAERDELNDDLDATSSRNIIGYLGAGVGGALVLTGTALLVFNQSPERRAAQAHLTPVLIPTSDGGWVGVQGRF